MRSVPDPHRCLPVLLALLLCSGVQGQVIVSHSWGFDGRVVANRFNLLTVHVRNPGDQPVDKHLELSKIAGFSQVGAPVEQRCYLGPGASRFLQFTPYISSPFDSWSLSWREGGAASARIGAPTAGPGAIVLLEEEPIERSRRMKVRGFPPRLLPVHAESMGGLRAVVMDRQPALSRPQRVALLDWLRRGGEFHLLLRNGLPVDLRDEFEVLASDQPVIAYGSGRVFRHAFDRASLRQEVPKELFGGPSPVTRSGWTGPVATRLREQVLQVQVELAYGWGLIFLLAGVYLVAIGPVFYRLSTQRLTWPMGLVTLAVIVSVATWGFNLIGARSGEVSVSRSWSFARPAGSDYEVTRFVNVFVTREGRYEFGDGDSVGTYSSAQDAERIDGRIHNGPKARYTVAMPRYSSRLVVHRNRVPGPAHQAGFDRVFRTTLPVQRVLAVNGERVIYFNRRASGEWVPGRSQSLRIFLASHQPSYGAMTLEDALIDRLGLPWCDATRPVTLPGHYVVLCEGPTPAEFHLRGSGPGDGGGLGSETGTTVYRFDFLRER